MLSPLIPVCGVQQTLWGVMLTGGFWRKRQQLTVFSRIALHYLPFGCFKDIILRSFLAKVVRAGGIQRHFWLSQLVWERDDRPCSDSSRDAARPPVRLMHRSNSQPKSHVLRATFKNWTKPYISLKKDPRLKEVN